MSADLMGVLAGVVCFLVLVVLFKHIDLQIRIKEVALVGSCVIWVGVLGGQVALSKRMKQTTK